MQSGHRAKLLPGERVGPYEVVDPIHANDGYVDYRARAVAGPRAGTSVLVRRFEALADDPFVHAFMSDAGLGTILQHPNIVQLYEILRTDDCYAMVFEYVDGKHLYELRLPIAAAIAVGIGIATGLHYAHEKTSASGEPLRIVHGSISPASVLIASDGQVKLTDFRLVRVPSSAHRQLKHLSPEQVRGQALDRRSDLFSLGIVLYEATTGRYPFAGDSDFAILSSITKQPIEPPSLRDPDYPRDLERIVMTALERDPERRQPTAKHLAEALAVVAAEVRLAGPSRFR